MGPKEGEEDDQSCFDVPLALEVRIAVDVDSDRETCVLSSSGKGSGEKGVHHIQHLDNG